MAASSLNDLLALWGKDALLAQSLGQRLWNLSWLEPQSLHRELWQAFAEYPAPAAERLKGLQLASNALWHVQQYNPAGAEQWWREWWQFYALPFHLWTEIGLVLAWKNGLAHLRQQALAYAESWSVSQQQQFLSGFTATALRQNPWLPQPCEYLTGGWRGWGGYLSDPPCVRWETDFLWVQDSQATWRVFADAWGLQWQLSSISGLMGASLYQNAHSRVSLEKNTLQLRITPMLYSPRYKVG